MTGKFIRITFLAGAFSWGGWLLAPNLGLRTAVAQAEVPASRQVVEVPLEQLNQIQDELRYLRARDAERQAWEESITSRLPSNQLDLISHGLAADGMSDFALPDSSAWQAKGHHHAACGGKCGSYPCERPLCPAPCLDCPHVSTLNPYFNVNIFGALKLDMLFNGARPVSPGVPFFLAPDSLTGLSQETVDFHARQTTLGAAFTGPPMGDLQSGGTFIAMLFNDNVLADRYGLLPLQAFGELRNDDWRFAAGLQFDVFAPGIPTTLPFSALAASGNAGNSFRGQLRLERFLHPADDVQWTLQTAVSEPITTVIDPTFGLNEDNGWPNVEARVALGFGMLDSAGPAPMRPFEMGVSGVIGQIRTTPLPPDPRVVADVWGLATDIRWSVNQHFGFMGEVYTGQALGTYNADILQTTNVDTLQGIRSSGGWGEVFAYLTPCLHSHTGFGVDDPLDRDVADSPLAFGRVYNSTIYSNLIWDPNPAFRVGFEFTWRETNYKAVLNPDNEGAGFHTQFQWSF